MSEYVKTNINHHIKFKPTENAKAIYRDRINGLLGDKIPEVSRELKIDEDGFCKMQMWEFFKNFGEHFGMGRRCVIDTEVFIET